MTWDYGEGNLPHNEWVTLDGHQITYCLSDGSHVEIIPDDKDTPSSWRIERHTFDPSAVEVLAPSLPSKAGALEFARRWFRDRKLTTVPSEVQRVRHMLAQAAPTNLAELDPAHDPGDAMSFARELDKMMQASRG